MSNFQSLEVVGRGSVSWAYRDRIVIVSRAYRDRIASVSWAYRERKVSVSRAFRERIVIVSWAYRERIVSVSWAYRERIVIVSWAYRERIVSVSRAYRPPHFSKWNSVTACYDVTDEWPGDADLVTHRLPRVKAPVIRHPPPPPPQDLILAHMLNHANYQSTLKICRSMKNHHEQWTGEMQHSG